MHLTGGQFKGRIIPKPKGETVEVRPTLSKVRESVFNILYSACGDFSNLSFLDMFAGSGIMALEAYSRGFKNICTIEQNPKTFAIIKQTFKTFNADINLIKGDSPKILSKLENFDVIYIDPPWDFEYPPVIGAAFKKLNKNGIIIVEYDKKDAKKARFSNETLPKTLPFKEKTYGRTNVDFYRG